MLCGRSCVWFCQDGLQFLDDLSFLDSCVHGQILCAMPVPLADRTTYPGMYANDPFVFIAHSSSWNCWGVYSGAFTMFASFLSLAGSGNTCRPSGCPMRREIIPRYYQIPVVFSLPRMLL